MTKSEKAVLFAEQMGRQLREAEAARDRYRDALLRVEGSKTLGDAKAIVTFIVHGICKHQRMVRMPDGKTMCQTCSQEWE
jgi:selenophosphate synthase